MPEKCGTIIEIMEKIAPSYLAQTWDNVGLQIGSLDNSVNTIMVTLDITDSVIDEAITKKVDLIISHHPLIFKPVKNITTHNPIGKNIHRMIKHDISIYCSHTNLDSAHRGTNEVLAQVIGLEDIKPFIKTDKELYYKLVVFVPENHLEKVRDSICEAGAGHIGNYSCCTFNSKGTGTFKPLHGTTSYIGTIGELEKVSEYRLETIVSNENLTTVINKMLAVHPYEEVAYDIIPLSNDYNEYGLARVGHLPSPMQLYLLCEELKLKLGLEHIKVVGNINKEIYRIGVCAGSGAEFIDAAFKAGCDCFITGDVKYHDAQYALQLGLAVIDAGHFETEQLLCDAVVEQLNTYVNNNAYDVNILKSATYINPFQYL